MRILTWNINGLRTLPQYHPWNTFKSLEGILEELNADIICFQEIKTTRANITRQIALPGPYDAFFSFPHSRHGYSGVSVFTNSRVCIPLRAEEGISGRLGAKHAKPPLSDAERISPAYPSPDDIDLMPDALEHRPLDLLELDTEGRALMLDFGLFVLINLYCPNETSDARLPYKVNFHRLLSERVRRLVEVEGREVVVLGDINVCAAPVDHVEGEIGGVVGEDGECEGEGGEKTRGGFWAHPARKWFRDWLAPSGPMHDVVRSCWPERKGMFTCWNTKISARASNYGTRIDYVLLTKGLLPWFKQGDIMPSVKGSDHCPVYVELHEEIVDAEGKRRVLREEMGMGNEEKIESGERVGRMPPRLSARHWDEFSGKQKLLSSFFGKKGSEEEKAASSSQTAPSSSQATLPPPTPDEEHALVKPTPAKRKKPIADGNYSSKNTKSASGGQAKLSAFFAGPSESKTEAVARIDVDEFTTSRCTSASSDRPANVSWSRLFAKPSPPRCVVHGEPAMELTVTKQGPNRGKMFYLCSRPVGPGYDAGKGVRPREDVNVAYRCNFFKWASEVRREKK